MSESLPQTMHNSAIFSVPETDSLGSIKESLKGKNDSQASGKFLPSLIALRHAEIDKNILIELNDSGRSFDQIADYLDITVNNVDMIESSI